LRNIAKKWTMPIKQWSQAMQAISIIFEGRVPTLDGKLVYTIHLTPALLASIMHFTLNLQSSQGVGIILNPWSIS
jgi:hypothetical protein